jgi:hypothetical protein
VLEISRSTVYYRPRPVSDVDLMLMRRIDELHMNYPFAGSRMLRDMLSHQGLEVGRRTGVSEYDAKWTVNTDALIERGAVEFYKGHGWRVQREFPLEKFGHSMFEMTKSSDMLPEL